MGVVKRAIKPMFKRNKWNILRGDTVKVLAGKDKGQTGTVTRVIRDDRVPKVLVEGLNLNKRHVKGDGADRPGGIFSVEAPIHYSSVALVDPVTKAAVRVTRRYLEDGTKVRITRGKLASESVIPRPEVLLSRRKLRPLPGVKDTSRETAQEVTFDPGDPLKGFGLPRPFSTATSAVRRPQSSCSAASNLSAFSWRRPSLFGLRGFAARGV